MCAGTWITHVPSNHHQCVHLISYFYLYWLYVFASAVLLSVRTIKVFFSFFSFRRISSLFCLPRALCQRHCGANLIRRCDYTLSNILIKLTTRQRQHIDEGDGHINAMSNKKKRRKIEMRKRRCGRAVKA